MVQVKEKSIEAGKKPIAHGVGRRKNAVARVWLRRGNGTVMINKQAVDKYFDTSIEVDAAQTPMRLVSSSAHYAIEANVKGGGKKAQADAVKLAIARSFIAFDESLRPLLKEHGLLTVDDRVKERKKYGQRAARRKFQFVKR